MTEITATAGTAAEQSIAPRLSAIMRATIWLLVAWFVTLIIEIPSESYLACTAVPPQSLCSNVAMFASAIVIEAIFMVLIIVFIAYGKRGKPWSFTGATVIGSLHAILSAGLYFGPGGPPLALAIWLTLSPALVAVAGAASVIELRRGKGRAPRPGIVGE